MIAHCLCKEAELFFFVSSNVKDIYLRSSTYQCLPLKTKKKKGIYSSKEYMESFLCIEDFLMNSSGTAVSIS